MLHVGIFKDHELGGDIVLNKGFRKNGVDVTEFDYRSVSHDSNVTTMNNLLIDIAKDYDLIFIGKGELVQAWALEKIRRKGVMVSVWYGDMRPSPEEWLIKNLEFTDFFFMTSAGDVLKRYFELGNPGIATFFLNPSSPDLIDKYTNVRRSIAPPLFSARMNKLADKERQQIYRHLCRRNDIEIIGSPKKYFGSNVVNKLYRRFNPAVTYRGKEYILRIKDLVQRMRRYNHSYAKKKI